METKTNNTLILIATVIIALLISLCWFQNRTLDKYRNLLEKVDTTTIVETDTVYREKLVVDSVPKYVHQIILKTDTVYQKEGDSISATPLLIALKKKKQPKLL